MTDFQLQPPMSGARRAFRGKSFTSGPCSVIPSPQNGVQSLAHGSSEVAVVTVEVTLVLAAVVTASC